MPVTRSQANALLRRLEGPVRSSFDRIIAASRGRVKVGALVQAIEAGDIDAIMLSAGIRDGMWSTLTEQLRTSFLEAGVFALTNTVPAKFGAEFNINNPRAEAWLAKKSSQLITGYLKPEQRAAIQEILQYGMSKGKNPRTVALDIVGRVGVTGRRSGGVIGLTKQQAQYVTNMMHDLEGLDPRYFNRKLRDRRFDKMVKRAIDTDTPISAKQRAHIVERYEAKMLKHRGDTIARTETLRSVNEASDEAMRQVVDDGLAPSNAITKVWRHSFSANEREGHVMMDGQRRMMDEDFNNPITGATLPYPGSGPGSETINCRCYIEHQVDFAAVERAA
jgi:hypothetical protein